MIFFAFTRPDNSEIRQQLYSWKDRMDMVRKLLTLLNSYTPLDVRNHAIGEYCVGEKNNLSWERFASGGKWTIYFLIILRNLLFHFVVHKRVYPVVWVSLNVHRP